MWFLGVFLLAIAVDVVTMSKLSGNGGLISEINRKRIEKQDPHQPLSASDIRSIFTTGKCCNDRNCMARLRLPKDPSCCPTCSFSSTTVFCGECPTPGDVASEQAQSAKITRYEALIQTIRKPFIKYRISPVETYTSVELVNLKKGLTTEVMKYFDQRFKETNDGKRVYRYEILCPAISEDYIPLCKTAWLALFGLSFEKVDYAQRQLKIGETQESRLINSGADNKPMDLKDAYSLFGLEYEDSWKYHAAYIDLEQVASTPRMLCAAVWIADEVIAIGDQEVR